MDEDEVQLNSYAVFLIEIWRAGEGEIEGGKPEGRREKEKIVNPAMAAANDDAVKIHMNVTLLPVPEPGPLIQQTRIQLIDLFFNHLKILFHLVDDFNVRIFYLNFQEKTP